MSNINGKNNEWKKYELENEYFDLSDQMYGGEEYNDKEIEAMKKRQDEILDKVKPIN